MDIDIAVHQESDGGFKVAIQGMTDVSQADLEAHLKKSLQEIGAEKKPTLALGREIERFYNSDWGVDTYYCDDAEQEIEDPVTGEALLNELKAYDLSLFGWFYPHDPESGLEPKPFQEAFLEWKRTSDPRVSSPGFPYTYAYDFIRMTLASKGGPLLSRSDVDQVFWAIGKAGISEVLLAEQVAFHYLENENQAVSDYLASSPDSSSA